MIKFEDEIKKYHPSLEIDDAEDAIYNQDMTDMIDVMLRMTKDSVMGTESTKARKQ